MEKLKINIEVTEIGDDVVFNHVDIAQDEKKGIKVLMPEPPSNLVVMIEGKKRFYVSILEIADAVYGLYKKGKEEIKTFTAFCFDCGRAKKNCKKIEKVIHTAWIDDPEYDEKKWLGKSICDDCLNKSRDLEKEMGKGCGFYEV